MLGYPKALLYSTMRDPFTDSKRRKKTDLDLSSGGLGKLPHNMDDSDLEVLREVDRFRRKYRRIPYATDILAILKSLGWKKLAR